VVQEIVPEVLRDRLNLPGELEPWIRLKVLAEVRATVVELPVREGDTVKKGDVLVRLDPRDYEIAVKSARAAHALARADLTRARDLFARELIPRAQLDQAETTLSTREAALENAELQLERTTIRAAVGGVVNRLDVEEGSLLSIGDPVAEILQIDRLKAVVGIPESDLNDLRAIRTVSFTVQALDDRTFTGTKHFLASAPDSIARLYRLELAVENTGGELMPGMFIRADVVKREAPEAIAVPLYAVISRGADRFVYVVNDDRAHRRPVSLGILEGWKIQITSGLSPGDRVIVVGHRAVEEGQVVQVRRTVTRPEDVVN
jgi:membrane fusion protein (multidrug efflux system)